MASPIAALIADLAAAARHSVASAAGGSCECRRLVATPRTAEVVAAIIVAAAIEMRVAEGKLAVAARLIAPRATGHPPDAAAGSPILADRAAADRALKDLVEASATGQLGPASLVSRAMPTAAMAIAAPSAAGRIVRTPTVAAQTAAIAIRLAPLAVVLAGVALAATGMNRTVADLIRIAAMANRLIRPDSLALVPIGGALLRITDPDEVTSLSIVM
jgi:hypothetical protein